LEVEIKHGIIGEGWVREKGRRTGAGCVAVLGEHAGSSPEESAGNEGAKASVAFFCCLSPMALLI
jgi:hypothetical protein